MADGRASKAARPRAAPRGLTADEFRATPEFARFKAVMRPLMTVPKAELDKMVRASKERRKPKRSRSRS